MNCRARCVTRDERGVGWTDRLPEKTKASRPVRSAGFDCLKLLKIGIEAIYGKARR